MVEINITKKERIYINPQTNERISGLQRGVVAPADLGSGGTDDKADTGRGAEEKN